MFSHSINQERTFIHHKTGQPTTMKTGNIGIRPESPDGYRGKNSHDGNLANGIVATCHACDQSYDGTKIKYCPYCYYTPDQRSDYLQAERQKRQEQDLLEELPAVKAEPKSAITAHGVPIKSISDFDKAAKHSPEVKAVDAWHKIYNAQRKVVVDFHRLYTQIGKEPLCETLRENDMMGDCDDMLQWVEKAVVFIKEIKNER